MSIRDGNDSNNLCWRYDNYKGMAMRKSLAYEGIWKPNLK